MHNKRIYPISKYTHTPLKTIHVYTLPNTATKLTSVNVLS